MSDSRIAPIRPSIARFLRKQIGGFVREYAREVNRGTEPPEQPEPAKRSEMPPSAGKPAASPAEAE